MSTVKSLESKGIRPIVVASHRRSGTHLVLDLLRWRFRECRGWKWPLEPVDRLNPYLHHIPGTQARGPGPEHLCRLLQRTARPVLKTHTCLGSKEFTDPMRQTEGYGELADFLRHHAQTVYVVRDGRAVLCSLWRFLEQTSPVPETIGEFIRERDNFYGGSVSRAKAWAEHVTAWLGSQPTSVLRFEDLVGDPDTSIAGLAKDFGLGTAMERQPPLPRPLKSPLEHRCIRLFGVRPEATTQLGRPSGKKPPKWREAFSKEDLAFFRQEAGEAMEAAGYLED